MNKIREFWSWFFNNCDKFGKNFSNDELLKELDKKVLLLGNGELDWEIGPGKIKENALVISPNGNHELLPFTKEIIDNAKERENWEYYYAIPPKNWKLIFYFETNVKTKIRVDASKWQYILLKYEDNSFDIIIKVIDLPKLSQDDKLSIDEILLIGILGEELRLEYIEEIKIVNKFKISDLKNASSIQTLSDHFNQLLL